MNAIFVELKNRSGSIFRMELHSARVARLLALTHGMKNAQCATQKTLCLQLIKSVSALNVGAKNETLL